MEFVHFHIDLCEGMWLSPPQSLQWLNLPSNRVSYPSPGGGKSKSYTSRLICVAPVPHRYMLRQSKYRGPAEHYFVPSSSGLSCYLSGNNGRPHTSPGLSRPSGGRFATVPNQRPVTAPAASPATETKPKGAAAALTAPPPPPPVAHASLSRASSASQAPQGIDTRLNR